MISSGWLRGVSLMQKGNLPSYLLLKSEVGSLFIPGSEGGRYSVHSLDMVHNPSGESRRKVGDEGGGIFQFIVLGLNNVQLERIDILLELLSRVDASGGQPGHGFSGGIVVPESCLEISLKLGEGSKRHGGQSLLATDFCPDGSRSLLHV